ncbi:hypothetical protein ACSQ67_023681 [Phaseolus vulgaris]
MVSHRAHTHPSAGFNNTRTYARAGDLGPSTTIHSGGAGGECEGKRAHGTEHGSYQWGEGGEEIPSLNTCGCCSHGERGEARGGDSDEGSEEKFGEDVLESEGSTAMLKNMRGGKTSKNAR